MKFRTYLLLMLVTGGLTARGQTPIPKPTLTPQQEEAWKAYLIDLYDTGVTDTKDSTVIGPETRRALQDPALRQTLYPVRYDWPLALELLKKGELKKALWHLVNLYPRDSTTRRLVVHTVLTYDAMLEMDKALTGAFYTYVLADPTATQVKNGKAHITRPDALEAKFKSFQNLVQQVYASRKDRAPNAPGKR